MQGTFEAQIEPPDQELEEVGSDVEYEDDDQYNMDETIPKRACLGAMANVPWGNLAPANDRATQQRMREHWEQEAMYTSMIDENKRYVPKVSPYPEGPDTVFPGKSCYKISVNGRTRHVFVLDPSAYDYPAGWNGVCQQQTAARWIVPHFIYRDERIVNILKKRWMDVYTYNSTQVPAQPPPPKDMYDSTLAGLAAPPAGDPALLVNDSYYAPGVPNPGAGAPAINDPVMMPAFNTNLRLNVNSTIVPFPYEQDVNLFPQRPEPPPVYQPAAPPAAGAPAAAPAAGAPAAPAAGGGMALRPRRAAVRIAGGRGGGAAGRGRGAAAGGAAAGGGGGAAAPAAPARPRRRPPTQNLDRVPPHESLLQVVPANQLRTGRAGVDWIGLDQANNLEISMDVLKAACEQGEEQDYAFALSMQGLRGTNLSAVWACVDPEYDVSDRSMVLAQFVKAYMEKFYQHVSVEGATDVEEVVHEALRMHEEFCKGWVMRHHRTLASEIAAASEALVGMFMDSLKPIIPAGLHLTRAHMSRYLRRHPDYSGEFAHCLYHYMTSTEHMRGNRNPSYRAMSNEKAAHVTSLNKMSEMLFERNNQESIRRDLQGVDNDTILFDWRFIDWHYVAAQMPQHHKEFDGYTNNFSLFRSRTGGRGNPFPPWQQMRRV